jgi:alkylation response protein AidB-like acyl-CoA dehydrogenase
MTIDLLPTLSDEQEMLAEASIRLMERSWPMTSVRAYADGAPGPDDGYLSTAAELGWFGLLVGESLGGGSVSTNGLVDAALIAAERGARLQPGPFVGHSVAVATLAAGATSQHPAVLQRFLGGTAWATCSLEVSDASAPTTRRSGDEWRVDGAIPVLAEVERCEQLVVAARGDHGTTLVLVDAGAAGVSIDTITGVDVTRRWSQVSFDSVHVELIAESSADTDVLLLRLRQLASVLQAAESVGAMQADFELALQYAKDRIAFGRPIGSFQAVKHLLADTSLSLEMAKAIVGAAAAALGSGAPDGPQLAHAAKAFVAARGIELAHNCFQVFGGIGFTWEHDQHLYFRRLAADAECFGSEMQHRDLLLDVAGVA